MTKHLRYIIYLLPIFGNCHHKMPEPVFGNFPRDVGAIFQKSCAVAGCHTEKSKIAAGGLSLESWEEMFNNENSNAVAIPFSSGQSPIFFFTNTFADLGPVNIPTMPVGSGPLCREEVLTIKNWLRNGAPSAGGKIMYADNPDREKVYVLNYTCSNVAVIDAVSGKVIRYISIPGRDAADKAEVVRVSADRKYWYVLFVSGKLLKYDASDDALVETLTCGSGSWRGLFLVSGHPIAIATSYTGNSDYNGGKISVIHTGTMREIKSFDSLYFPEGTIADEDLRYIYTSCNTGNFIYRIAHFTTQNPVISKMPIGHNLPSFDVPEMRPGSLCMSGENKLLVLCKKSNELRVIDLDTQMPDHVVEIGMGPEELLVLSDKSQVAISCSEDRTTHGKGKGHVFLVDVDQGKILTKWYSGYQPKGLALDSKKEILMVTNKNADPVGADKPHHYTECKGNNGYITIIDLKKMEVIKGSKTEVGVNPFAIAYR